MSMFFTPIAQAAAIQTQAVHFAKGHTSATMKGSVKGDQTIDYTVRAKAGQTMSVQLASKHRSNYFNVLPPGSNDEALFVGSSDGNAWTGKLPTDGEYKLRVYLMRNAARRNEQANYTLSVSISAASSPAVLGAAPASDAKVKGTPFHATGSLPCQMGKDKPALCEFGVIRGKIGNAEVQINPPGGLKRVLIFTGDTVTSGSSGEKIKALKQGDDWLIEVNDYERYTIMQAVVLGG
ncbi:MAG TPA: hypothetical protein PKC80_10160 [Burkholderiaceae bacterium]|nr:hypothetical protein [Burkholderiaceae bacterium]